MLEVGEVRRFPCLGRRIRRLRSNRVVLVRMRDREGHSSRIRLGIWACLVSRLRLARQVARVRKLETPSLHYSVNLLLRQRQVRDKAIHRPLHRRLLHRLLHRILRRRGGEVATVANPLLRRKGLATVAKLVRPAGSLPGWLEGRLAGRQGSKPSALGSAEPSGQWPTLPPSSSWLLPCCGFRHWSRRCPQSARDRR